MKTDRITNWPVPQNATQVRSFLGLVRYIAAFLLNLATHTGVLIELTYKECDKHFPTWEPKHQYMFDEIKKLLLSQDCLTTINYTKMPGHKTFVTTDMSDTRFGAVLSFGETWESARSVAFNSKLPN